MEQTLFIIKPDAVKRNLIGEVIKRIENEGFEIIELKLLKLTLHQAQEFYKVHKSKPFYEPLCKFMSSGKSIFCVLEREDAIAHLRKVIGVTDPQKAEKGTIRALFGGSIQENIVHASDSKQSAEQEIAFLKTLLASS